MIRGRKEGSTYATWFIGFDHDDTFGLPAFPELPPQTSRTPVHSKPVSRATSLETLLPTGLSNDSQSTQRYLTPAATQTSNHISKQTSTQTTEETATQTAHQVSTQTTTYISSEVSTDTFEPVVVSRSQVSSQNNTRPRSQDFDSTDSRRRNDKDTRGLYRKAFDGAKTSEELKFRAKFNKLVEDLHVAVAEKNHNGLTSFTSPSYGDVMLTFKEKVKELLRGFTHRLQLAYESFGREDTAENTGQKVKQNVSRFIEELIGETLDLTSDEAVSDLSSLSDDSTSEQNSFEDLIAQAVVSKLLQNHRKEVSESVQSSNNHNKKDNFKDQETETTEIPRFHSENFNSYDYSDRNQNINGDNIVDGTTRSSSKKQKETTSRIHNGGSFRDPNLFNVKSNLIPDDREEEDFNENCDLHFQSEENNVNRKSDTSNRLNSTNNNSHFINGTGELNGKNSGGIENDVSDEETDIVKEFEQFREFVKNARLTSRPKIEAVPFDDSGLCEAKEETLLPTKVDREEEREEFHTRYSIFDRIHNYEQPLPDFSQFENIDFSSDEVDPDLLSMNLAIIPEETEEELELEEEDDEQNRWDANWLFKGKGHENMGKKTVTLNTKTSAHMMVPRPGDHYSPKIGHRDVDQLSDFSDHDLIDRTDLDGSDDDENTFYANTSKELARISGQRSGSFQRLSSGSHSDNSDMDESSIRRKTQQLYDRITLDDIDSMHIPGPIVEPSKQELKLLQELVPSENDDPKFILAPESVTVQEGEPVRFTCRVAGTSPTDVFWYREGDEVEELEESEDVEITTSGDKNSIVIYNTSKKMAGQYMCIVLNEKGKAIQYLVVTVKDNKQDLKKPEFLKGLKDVDVTEGQSVKFRVKVKGFPPPRITWYKDGEILKSSKTCRIEKFGNRDYILTIDYASMHDDAEYTVSARNVAGEEKLSAQVIVEPQSELPIRKQKASSNTTSGASDSDSDRSISRLSLKPPAGPSFSSNALQSSKGSMQDKEDQLRINQIDRKVTVTQIQLNNETEKMRGVPEKDETPERRRLITDEALDVLKAADEIIQQEKDAAERGSKAVINGDEHSPIFQDNTNSDKVPSTFSLTQSSNGDSLVDDLILPDTLDEFPLQILRSRSPVHVKSDLELTLSGRNENKFSGREAGSERFQSEVKSLKESTETSELQPLQVNSDSFRNQNQTQFNSVLSSNNNRGLPPLAESLIVSDASLRDGEQTEPELNLSRQQLLREQYSRDFEVPQTTEKKRWSVTLDSFSPQAEIVNKLSESKQLNEGANSIEISITDASSPSFIPVLKGDNTSQSSSRRQSSDSGVSVSSKQKRPAPVHMVGHTTEEDVPESRTEFNTDGSIELPSVNRLKAMFASLQDDDLGNGTFKRIHSITARNVPKEKLEKLRATNQNVSSSQSSGPFLEVPNSPPSSVTQRRNSNSSLYLTTPTLPSKVTLTSAPLSVDSVPQKQQIKLQTPATGAFRDLDPDRDPVLIYPETDPEFLHRHHSHQPQPQPVEGRTLTKSSRALLPPQHHQTSTAAVTITTTPSSKVPHHHQTKLPVQQAMTNNDENENVKKSGPRIRSGCISARAAFWERKIVDGGAADDDEFPEMVEDGDT